MMAAGLMLASVWAAGVPAHRSAGLSQSGRHAPLPEGKGRCWIKGFRRHQIHWASLVVHLRVQEGC